MSLDVVGADLAPNGVADQPRYLTVIVSAKLFDLVTDHADECRK